MESPKKSPEDLNLKKTDTEGQTKKLTAKFLLFESATEFAILIGLPLIAFAYLGKWLSAKYHTKLFILLAVPLAIAVSSVAIGKKINAIRKKIQ